MIRLFVSDFVLLCHSPWLWPPVRSFLITSSVGMRGLLLRLYSLDPSLCDELTGRLLATLETLVVEVPKRRTITHPDSFPASHWNRGYWCNVIVIHIMTCSGSLTT